MKKFLALFLAVLMVMALFVGCASDTGKSDADAGDTGSTDSKDESADKADDSSAKDGEKYQIGFIASDFSHPWVADFLKGAYTAIDEISDYADVTVLDGQGNEVVQVEAMEQLMMQEVDMIILAPISTTSLTPSVEEANNRGIPVVEVNCFTDGGEYTYVGSQDYDAGYLQGQWAAENLPEGTNYLYMYLEMGQSGQILREEGFVDAIEEADRSDLNLLAAQTADGFRDQAMKLMEDWIQTYGDKIDAVIFQTETMALGALEALNAAGMDDVIISTVDVSSESIEAMQQDKIATCIFQDAMAQSYWAVHTALNILNGEWDPAEDYIIPFKVVTPENAEKFSAYYEQETYDPNILEGVE